MNEATDKRTPMIEGISTHPGFAKLCEALSVFNPFEVLGLETYELRHTKTLAWLLDPKGSHNLGTAFVERFLTGLPARLSTHLPANLDAARVFSELPVKDKTLRLGDAVPSEAIEATGKDSSKRIDVYMQVEPTFFLAIEAKIGADEHGDQLEHYREAVQKQAAGRAVPALLYLTLDGAEPAQQREREYWTAINWHDHVLVPLQATLQDAQRGQSGAGQAGSSVMHFLSDYATTLQKVTGSREYAPRVLAEEILTEETYKGPLGAMIDVLHSRDSAAKARLRLQLKGIKGGEEAANLLQSVEADLRAKACNTLAAGLVRDDWVRIGTGTRRQGQSVDSTKIDFMTQKMVTLMGTVAPPFFFRLDIRRTNTIELKLFFENPELFGPGKPLSSLQQALMGWSGDEWAGLTATTWNLGQAVGKGGIGQKMAVKTFGGISTTIVRIMPDAEAIKPVQEWLAKVACFVDRKMDEMLEATA